MSINSNFPNKDILEITFLNEPDFYHISYQNRDFLIVAKDKDINTNLIGITITGEVYYLTLADTRVCYIANNIDVFIAELLAFDDYMKHEPNDLSVFSDELQLSQFANEFRNIILKLDKSAFEGNNEEDTFWAEVCEEIEYGIL